MKEFLFESDRTRRQREIYNRFQDEQSREIYKVRSLFSLTDDRKLMRDVIRNMSISKDLVRIVSDKGRSHTIVLFGCGQWGEQILDLFPDFNIQYVADNRLKGNDWNGFKVISPEIIREIENPFVIISVMFHFEEIEMQLQEYGITDYYSPGRNVNKKQYFDLKQLKFSNNEIFVDVGSYDGKTSKQFISIVNNEYDHIYCFECNSEMFDILTNQMHSINNCTIIPKGVWSKSGNLYFKNEGEGSHIIDDHDESNKCIEVIALDEVLLDKKVTYIKMDIEGAEKEALIGCEKIIRKYKPKLAISVYHKRFDIWDIPLKILEYNPEYKFYLRLYSFTGNDTVLYAI